MMPLFFKISSLAVFCMLASLQGAYGDKFFVKEKNRLIPIVGAEKHHPMVELRGKRQTIKNGDIVVKSGSNPGLSAQSMELEAIKIVSHTKPSSKLTVELSLKTDALIEGACLCIRTDASTDENIEGVVLELPSLSPNSENSVRATIPMALNWDLGSLFVSASLDGKKIAIEHDETDRGRAEHGDSYAGMGVAKTALVPDSAFPRALFQVAPERPSQALLDSAEGVYVTVEFFIDVDGVVREADSQDYSHEQLVKSVLEAMRKSKYLPGYKDGSPYRTKLKQTVWFKRPAKR